VVVIVIPPFSTTVRENHTPTRDEHMDPAALADLEEGQCPEIVKPNGKLNLPSIGVRSRPNRVILIPEPLGSKLAKDGQQGPTRKFQGSNTFVSTEKNPRQQPLVAPPTCRLSALRHRQLRRLCRLPTSRLCAFQHRSSALRHRLTNQVSRLLRLPTSPLRLLPSSQLGVFRHRLGAFQHRLRTVRHLALRHRTFDVARIRQVSTIRLMEAGVQVE
jgi:hypothetical protein